MKKMKKIASLALALVLALALCVPAMAAPATTPAAITIQNASKGATYSAYKLFDASVNANDGIVYTGTIPESLEAYFTKNDANEIFAYVVNEEGKKVAVNELSEDAVAALKAWADTQETPAATDDGDGGALTLDVSKSGYGYYVVTSTIDSGAAITVTSTNPTASVYDKNSAGTPTIDPAEGKTVVGGLTYDIGDTVTYRVAFNTVNWVGAGETSKQVVEYTIKDTASSGFLANVTVTDITVDSTSIGAIQFEDGKIVIPWVDDDNNSLYDNSAEVVITYTATVTGVGTGNNRVELSYKTDDGNEPTVPVAPEVDIYTSTIVVDKFTMVGEGEAAVNTKLEGAKFVLKNAEGKFYKWVEAKEATEVEEAVLAHVEWVDTQAEATEVETDANGAASFVGLKDGTYYLVETEAPAGYNLATEPTSVTVSAADATHAVSYTSPVLNLSGATLPSTGGIGTTIFYVVGGILVAAAAILLITKKRMSMAD